MCSRLLILGGMLTTLVASCGGEEMACPGNFHKDCYAGAPVMTIQTLDGQSSIAGVNVIQGPCYEQRSQPSLVGYAQEVTIAAKPVYSCDAAPPGDSCTIEVISRFHRCTTVTVTTEWRQDPPRYRCSDLENPECCPPSHVVQIPRGHLEFTQQVIPISFGDRICAGYDAGVVNTGALDGGAVDSAID